MRNLDFTNKKVAVLGMGIEGLSVCNFLTDSGANLFALDKNSEENLLKGLEGEEKSNLQKIINNEKIKKIFGESYLNNLSQYDILFRTPGISFNHPKIIDAKNKGVVITSQIKLFFDLCPCQIIGVTGTKGKGTTASLIFSILEKKFQNPNSNLSIKNSKFRQSVYLAGNIGYPAIDLIPKLNKDDIVILELSSFQLMDLEKSPHIAVVTNLTVDHLDYHKDLKEYQISKFNILKYQSEKNFMVLNKNSTFSPEILKNARANIKYFSLGNSDSAAMVEDDKVILDPKNRKIDICHLGEIKLFGRHNLENIAAAAIVADILNIDAEITQEVVKSFKGLPHRIEFVAEIDGVKYINDSYATNPDPTMAAINSFAENKIIILGGSSKGANFSELAEKIAESKVTGTILIGQESEKIKEALIKAAYKGKIMDGAVNIEEAVEQTRQISKPGDVVLLSPACASFGMFKNYKDRGEKFKRAVLDLDKKQ